MSATVVCVLAYNEEKHIRATVEAVLKGSSADLSVALYPNGCTDRTVPICHELATEHSNVKVNVIAKGSKPNAWNIAFAEHSKADFIVFADGDVIPDPGAAEGLVEELRRNPHAIIASCRQIPVLRGRGWQPALVGILQMPLHQDFLAGGFFAVRRQALANLFVEGGYPSLLPLGVTGEDCLLAYLTGPDRLVVSELRSAYEPPNLRDYCRYLARMRWQNEQVALMFPPRAHSGRTESGALARFAGKFRRSRNKARFFASFFAVAGKFAFNLLAAPAIKKSYLKLGPVREDGASILANATRSSSAK